jgi:hypothetical protein
MTIEQHPLEPFVPEGATTLFLGSFPPPRERSAPGLSSPGSLPAGLPKYAFSCSFSFGLK